MQIWETKNITLFDKAKYITGKSMFVGIYAYYIVIGKYLLNQLDRVEDSISDNVWHIMGTNFRLVISTFVFRLSVINDIIRTAFWIWISQNYNMSFKEKI